MQENEKRMAGDYEIIHALQVGDREIVLGENLMDVNGQKYMCAFCTANELFAQYDDLYVSDDYTEVLKYYGERITKQAEKTRAELSKSRIQGIDNTPITAGVCDSINYMDNIESKVIVIKPEVLKREYRSATHQLKLCTGGFGSHPNSRGSACFCTDLYSGKSARFERMDVLGTMEPDDLPEWASIGLNTIRQAEKQKKSIDKEAR